MKIKKIFALILASTMILSLVACGETGEISTSSDNSAGAETAEVSANNADVTAMTDPSTDFSDGNFGFIGCDKVVNPNADNSVISLSEFDGTSAVKIEAQGAAPFVAIQMDTMLGEKISDVAAVAVTIGTESADGAFYATSGNIYSVISGEKLDVEPWSIYKEEINPKTAVLELSAPAAEGDYVVVSLESDVAVEDKGLAQTSMYILDVTFMDSEGNTLDVDTTAVYTAPSTGTDRSNLYGITGAVNFEGFETTGDSWAQSGFNMTEEFKAALVPGSVIEVSYSSESGNMWVVFPDDGNWTRVGVGNVDNSGKESAIYNGSRNICQIPYEMIVALEGSEDVSTWGARLQCESDTPWEVYSVTVAQRAPSYAITNAVDSGWSGTGGGWAQAGFEMSEEFKAALVPGSLVEIKYASESGNMWMVLPDDGNWTRVGVGDIDDSGKELAFMDGSTCYIPFEMIAALEGSEDVSTWGARLQCESDTEWEVYSVRVGTAAEFLPLKDVVEFEGFECSGDAWAQSGFDMPQEILDALVPGSVITINYSSESGNMWVVFPDDGNWTRVGVGNTDDSGKEYDICNGTTCQVTFEMIAALEGSEDVSTWGARLQCESDTPWEVYGISVGQAIR